MLGWKQAQMHVLLCGISKYSVFAVHFNGIYVIDRERKMKHLLSMTFFLSQVC